MFYYHLFNRCIMSVTYSNDYPPCRLGLKYADCFSCRGVSHSCKKWGPGYDTKLYLIVRLHSWKYRKYGVYLHCHYSQIQPNPKW